MIVIYRSLQETLTSRFVAPRLHDLRFASQKKGIKRFSSFEWRFWPGKAPTTSLHWTATLQDTFVKTAFGAMCRTPQPSWGPTFEHNPDPTLVSQVEEHIIDLRARKSATTSPPFSLTLIRSTFNQSLPGFCPSSTRFSSASWRSHSRPTRKHRDPPPRPRRRRAGRRRRRRKRCRRPAGRGMQAMRRPSHLMPNWLLQVGPWRTTAWDGCCWTSSSATNPGEALWSLKQGQPLMEKLGD